MDDCIPIVKNNIAKTQRLTNSNYKRPKTTYTDTIQNKKDMLEKLKNYEPVDDIDDISLNTHVRYVTLDRKTKKQVFRLGGLLTKKHSRYVICSNGRFSWSVQRYHYNDEDEDPIFETKFWKVLTKEELMRKTILEQQQEIEKLKKQKNK